jgi:hypothetical protein
LLWKLVCGWECLLSAGGRKRGLLSAALCFVLLAFPYIWSIKALFVFPSGISPYLMRTLPSHMALRIERGTLKSYPRLESDFPRAAGLKLSLWATRPHNPFVVEDVYKIIRFIRKHAEKDDRILVMCEPQIIYFLSEKPYFLSKENYFIYLATSGFIDGVERERFSDDTILKQFSSGKPRFIIRQREGKYSEGRQMIANILPETARFIDDNYETVRLFGAYEVLHPRTF